MKIHAVFLVCVTFLFTLSPQLFPNFQTYDPDDFWVRVTTPAAQPAEYTRSIWPLIQAGLMGHAVYGLVKHAEDPAWHANRQMLMVAMLLGTFWMAIADSMPVFATSIILVMAAAALLALLRTGRGGLWQQPPVALFAGWMTAAAGFAWGVTAAGLGMLSNLASAYATLGVVLLVAMGVQRALGRVPAYAAAVVWALIGMAASNWGVNPGLVVTALLGATVMAATPFIRT